MSVPNASSILLELEAAGLEISTDGVGVTLRGPASALTTDLRARVVGSKRSILALLAPRLVASSIKCDDCSVPPATHGAHVEQSGGGVAPNCSSSHEVSSGEACVTCGTTTSAAGSQQSACVAAALIPIVVDFETRSPVSLEQSGGRAYARHPDTEVLCAVFILPDGKVIEWTPANAPPQAAFDLAAGGVPVMAHNAHGFDRFVWQRLGWPEVTWIDSLSLARLSGLPGKLQALAEAVLDIKKDVEGRDVTLAAGRLDRSGRFPVVPPATLTTIIKYCRVDTLIVKKAWQKALAPALLVEPDVREVDVVVNERGFLFDTKLAEALIHCESKLAEESRRSARVEARVLASPRKLKGVLAGGGVDVADVRRATLLALLDDPDLPDDIRAIIAARLASAGIASHKLRAALRRIDDDARLRDTLSYCQAHTGRWAGRGFQPQNLPRGADFKTDADIERAIEAVMREDLVTLHEIALSLGASVHSVCASLVRSCVFAPVGQVLAVVDYAQIEARALLWLAGDDAALARFGNDAVDPYRAMAAQLFGVTEKQIDATQRQLGKALVLGCGYQMGSTRFESYGATYKIDWSTLGITPKQAVEAWRAAHPAIAGSPSRSASGDFIREGGLWRRMQEAAERAARGGRTRVGSLVWDQHGQDVVCALPSGRPLVYRNARLELQRTPWGKEQSVFTYELRGQRVSTYGGKLTENVTQALCRDLLANALVRLHRAGIRIVLHVHDEIVAELEDESQFAEMVALMCQVPPWAEGLPLKATGHTGRRYRK